MAEAQLVRERVCGAPVRGGPRGQLARRVVGLGEAPHGPGDARPRPLAALRGRPGAGRVEAELVAHVVAVADRVARRALVRGDRVVFLAAAEGRVRAVARVARERGALRGAHLVPRDGGGDGAARGRARGRDRARGGRVDGRGALGRAERAPRRRGRAGEDAGRLLVLGLDDRADGRGVAREQRAAGGALVDQPVE